MTDRRRLADGIEQRPGASTAMRLAVGVTTLVVSAGFALAMQQHVGQILGVLGAWSVGGLTVFAAWPLKQWLDGDSDIQLIKRKGRHD